MGLHATIVKIWKVEMRDFTKIYETLFLQMFLFTHAIELGALLILLNLLKFISTSISL